MATYFDFIAKDPNGIFKFEYAAIFFIIACYLFLRNRPDYILNIYDDRVQVKYRKKDERDKDRTIYYKDIKDFFYMHKYVAIKEKDKDEWYFIKDKVGFGASNDIQQAHKRFFLPKYKEKFNSGEDLEFRYLDEKALNEDEFNNLEKTFILNKEYMEIGDRRIYLKDIQKTTYHPDGRARHDPVDIAFLDEDLEVLYIFPDRTLSNYMIFHDLIEGYLLENKLIEQYK